MLKRFSEIGMNDVSTCGGKGASLGEMKYAGFPIPDGFVLTIKAYGKDQSKWEKQVLAAFDKLNTKFVAVRSSGTKEDGVDDSFAGQFDTYLFVTRENLIKKIKECHDSVNSERIVSYCEYKGIDIKSIKVAVVVQKMVNSESAGVCFTVNPVSQNPDEIMIDAGYGVGEAVVSGMITPDNYIVNKKTGEIKKNISQQEKKLVLSDRGGTMEVEIAKEEQETQKLSDKHIEELAELAKKIEKHYGKPMDTEWAIENGELFMLQARPITTLGNISSKQSLDFDGSNFQPELRKNSQIYYNYQGLPFFTSIFEKCSSLEESRYSTPILYISKYTNDNKIISYLSGDFIGKGYNMINDLLNQKEDAKIFLARKNDLVTNCIKKCEKYISSKRTDFFNIRDDIQTAFADGRYVCNISYALQDYLNKLKESDHDLFECLQSNISPCEETFLNKAEKYLKELVNKNPKNFDVVYKKFMEKFYWFQNSYLGVKTISKEWLLNYYKELINKKDKKLIKSKKPKLPKKYKLLIETASNAVNYQDNRKKLGLIVNEIMERWLKNLSKQTNISYDDLVWLTVDEIKSYNISIKKGIGDLKNKISSYKNSGKRFWILSKNRYIDTDENLWTKVVELNTGNKNGINLKGAIGNKGKYIGKAKIVLNIDKDGKKFEKGDILVTGMTRPEFVPIMRKAGAFITDEGGVTCHAAIISRELGKPCIIGTKIATQVLKDGDLVEVDADNGIMKILENKNQGDNLEIKIGNKTFTPEFRQHENTIHFSYQGVPFFSCIFSKCCTTNDTERTTPANYVCQFNNLETATQYVIGDFVEKGENMIGTMIKGKKDASIFLKKQDEIVLKCIKKCDKYIRDGKTNFLDIRNEIKLAFEAGCHVINLSYALQKYLENLNKTNQKLYKSISENINATKKSFVNEAGDYLKRLIQKYSDNFEKVYNEFMEKYGWFQNSYLGIKHIDKKRLKEYAEELTKTPTSKVSKKKTKIEKKYSQLVETASNAIIYQDNKKRLGFMSMQIMENRLRNYSKKIKIPYNDLLWLTVEEIIENDEKTIKNKINEYKQTGKRICIMTEKGYTDIPEEFWLKVTELNKPQNNIKSFKGITGCKGKYTGNVKIISNIEKDRNKFKKGDILVTGMTRPEFVPLIKKAGGIITNEGGITCHAAIISRELGIPCVIGTKIATQVLKDGDLVEVDADNGVVKILS